MFKITTIIPFILLVIGVSLQSCKKTELEYEQSPYNSIKRFTVLGSTGDSTRCLINGDSITVFWNPDVALPSSIRPSIVVEPGAVISPGSGESVPFNRNTVYTVTAQNGTVKTYRLTPSQTVPFPVVSGVNAAAWLSTTQLNITGEYFLANTDTSAVQVYMQRVSDGFEFPLTLIKQLTTNYSLRVTLPPFSTEHEVGLHRLYVKAGSRIARPYNVNMLVPAINYVTRVSDFSQKGKDLHAGDEVTVTYTATDNYGGAIAKHYNTSGVQSLLLFIDYDNMPAVTDFTITENTIKFKIPDSIKSHIGKEITQVRLLFKAVPQESVTSSSYRHDVSFWDTPSKIVAN